MTYPVHLYSRYALAPNAPEVDALNVLIQRSVESGILQFYKRLESFLGKIRKPVDGRQQVQSEVITMEHIRIYLYGFLIANGLCTLVFFGEIMHFHRKTIFAYLRRGIVAAHGMLRRMKNGLFLLIRSMWRFCGRCYARISKVIGWMGNRFGDRCLAGMQRTMQWIRYRLFGRCIAGMQKIMQWMKNPSCGRRVVRMQEMMPCMRNRRTKIHPFHQKNWMSITTKFTWYLHIRDYPNVIVALKKNV